MDNTILKAKSLIVSYKDNMILDDVSFEVEKGKIYSIIGPNGCGKTTLMKTISRNLKPKSGKVLLDEKNIFKTNTKLVSQKMAVLSQSNSSISDVTVRTLVQYGRYSHKKWWQGNNESDTKIIDWALNKTGMEKFEDRKVNTLSGGERQRAWIAMSIAQKPEILLLDEPTTYLDISHQLEIMELIKRLNKEESITIVMVLHDINHAARYSDNLIVINNHKIFQIGDPWTVLENNVLDKVFRVEAEISKDKENGKPIFYAKRVVK
ncbi:ABC transporter ATP-binding protein [Paludicola sp. MB14-C6]|uniref:ABC transporter ATP-binding protein n=1 Tax=Paludihabitans sp. MB14-C6 TaxID=3070656 RepID=UPI0027DB1051|nr:ABC transporter ATP-binding protein [Paludicola sp. MB14-C6]WMJ23138.1 ABC transporter ATP-binding protein [Paludicola sp. MB14-C6]